MQKVIEQITSELQLLLTKTKELESKYMGQILALQKVINHSRKTMPEVVKKEAKKIEQVKQELTQESIDCKVDAMLMEIEQKQKMLEQNPKQKLQVKTPEPVVERKPPIPSANRVDRSNKPSIPTYIPPRNKNEVTGKITQTTIKTSTQKVFRPEITGMKKSNSREFSKSKNTEKRQQTSASKIEKRIEQIAPRYENDTKSKSANLSMQNKPSNHQSKQTVVPKEQTVGKELATFNKSLEQALQEILRKGQKNRKPILEKMIRECQSEERGHKKNEETSRLTFVKHVNNLALSSNEVNPIFTHKLTRSKWRYYPELFELSSILSSLQSQIGNIQNLKQYKLDPRQEYRIMQTSIKLSELLGRIDQDKSHVPAPLDINFSHREISQPVAQQSDDFQQLSQLKLNQDLSRLLEQLSESSELLKPQLRGLQVLTEVGIFKSKKSPILLMQEQYSSWKQYYFSE